MTLARLVVATVVILGIVLAIYATRAIDLPIALGESHVIVVTPEPTQPASALHYDQLVEQVAPASGITIEVRWGDMGQKLVEAGAIDLEKFEALYGNLNDEQRAILQGNHLDQITFTPQNIQFWTNVLWALGLTQESAVLSDGPMKQREDEIPLGNYASTGGWTLGSLSAVELYNSVRLIELTPEQDDLVYQVAEAVFRPCCGNPAVYPDCNHGMAVLGLLELLASQGADETQLYQAALAFNSYAFMNTYTTIAAYFVMQDIAWGDVEKEQVLGADFSSAQGARRITAQVGAIPGAPLQRGSCSP